MTEETKDDIPQQPLRIDQIVELAAQGMTDKQIASHLGISRHTVDSHWRRLREKSGLSARTALVQSRQQEKSRAMSGAS